MFRRFAGVLALFGCLITWNMDCLGAEEYTSYDYGSYQGTTYKSDSSNYQTTSTSSRRRSESSEEQSEQNFYPFKKATNKINDEAVRGIRVTNDSFVIFDETTYWEERSGSDLSEFDVFSKYRNLVSIDLCKLTLTRTILENLKKFLPQNLQSIIITSCGIDKENYQLLMDLISDQKQLISVSFVAPEYELAEATTLTAVLAQMQNLKYLKLVLGTIGQEACEHLVSCLRNSSGTMLGLTLGFMKVEESESFKKLLETIREPKNLTRLEISIMEILSDQVDIFFDSLTELNQLKYLKFDFEQPKNKDGVAIYKNTQQLCEALKKMKDLQSLDISEMHLQGAAMQLIADTLQYLTHLQTLNISGNMIDAKTAELLGNSFKETGMLSVFAANDCGITAEAFSSLASGFAGLPLRYLYLRNNKIGTRITSLPLDRIRTVILIDFSNNDIDWDTFEEFVKSVKDNPSLLVVIFKGNQPIMAMTSEEKTHRNDELKMWLISNGFNKLLTQFLGI